MAETTARPASAFIAGPITDSVFLIAAPLLAVPVFVATWMIPSMTFPLPTGSTILDAENLAEALLAVVIASHLFIVFFRSHLNPGIFKLYPFRFTVVPLALFASMYASIWVMAIVGFVGVYWDVYHSALQTFGIGRIYDQRKGNDPLVGRRLDYLLNLLLYCGPILGGATLIGHIRQHEEPLHEAPVLYDALFAWIPAASETYARELTWGMLAIGIPFCVYYVYAYWRLAQQGYQVSFQKVSLLVILALVSMACWGFNSFGEAFFVMNFFHAWQYFFLVWFMERRHITSFFRLTGFELGQQMALAAFLFIGVGYGVWTTLSPEAAQFDKRTMNATLLVVSIMHFWYDGFIWSVRRGQV